MKRVNLHRLWFVVRWNGWSCQFLATCTRSWRSVWWHWSSPGCWWYRRCVFVRLRVLSCIGLGRADLSVAFRIRIETSGKVRLNFSLYDCTQHFRLLQWRSQRQGSQKSTRLARLVLQIEPMRSCLSHWGCRHLNVVWALIPGRFGLISEILLFVTLRRIPGIFLKFGSNRNSILDRPRNLIASSSARLCAFEWRWRLPHEAVWL